MVGGEVRQLQFQFDPQRLIQYGVSVEDVIAALRRLRPVEVSVLPGIEETVEFRIPADLLRGPRVTDPAA